MSDSISRADAIEAIASRDETDGTVKVFTGREVNEIISALPSAEPKTGKWIEVEKNEYEGFSIVNMRCNQCGRYAYLVLPKGTKCVYDYCPNCGVKMVREDGEA